MRFYLTRLQYRALPILSGREKNGKTGAASPRLRAAAYSNPASMFIDNPTCDPQAKTCTLLTFCGEEWLKQFFADSHEKHPVRCLQ